VEIARENVFAGDGSNTRWNRPVQPAPTRTATDKELRPMRDTILLVTITLASSACSTTCSFGRPIEHPDGKPIAGHDDARDSTGKSIGDDDDDDTITAKTTGANADAPTKTSPPDCIPGKAKGHEKDKAQGEAKGHDRPPCPDDEGEDDTRPTDDKAADLPATAEKPHEKPPTKPSVKSK
jgi:hypothetical protein